MRCRTAIRQLIPPRALTRRPPRGSSAAVRTRRTAAAVDLFADRRHGPLQSVQPVRQVVEQVRGGQELQVGAGPADRPAGGLVQCGPPGRPGRAGPAPPPRRAARGRPTAGRAGPPAGTPAPARPRPPAGRCAGRRRGRSTLAGSRSSPRSPRPAPIRAASRRAVMSTRSRLRPRTSTS